MVTSSLPDPDNLIKYTTNPNKIFDYWRNKVDLIIDSGNSGIIPSTVVDLTEVEPIIIRRGKGKFV
jgi:tRNA A37 threonylcarbamoyladenosine synthetase subunit TsaC/SUA5/YrdC